MNANGFREDELVSRKVKINGEWQTRTFPVVGGRLALSPRAKRQAEPANQAGELGWSICGLSSAALSPAKGSSYGYWHRQQPKRCPTCRKPVELAETRSIARALRFAGFGLEFTGAEEVSHVAATEPEPEQTTGKESKPVFPEATQSNKEETKSGGNGNGKAGAPNGATVTEKINTAKLRQRSGHPGASESFVCLGKKTGLSDGEKSNLLSPLSASSFQDLTREDASRLISRLQSQVA